MGNYVIPKMPGESAITWNGTNYWPVSSWTIGPGISTGSGDSWIAGAVRYLVGEDSNNGSVHVIAQFSAYTRTGGIDTSNGYFLIRRIGSSITTYTGTQSQPGDFWTTQNSNQRQGYVYNIVRTGSFLWYDTPYFMQDFGTKTEGTTVTAATFYVGTSEVIGGVYQQTSVSASYTIPKAPSTPTSITNTRNSDTQNTVSWVLPATTYTRMRLQRLVDGSTMQKEWTFASTSGVTSYVDTGTSAGHSYTYRLRLELVPEAGEAYKLSSSWKTSSATYNTPARPTAISGARTAASTVRVTLTNTATTSTGLEVQASTDPADWSGAISQTYVGAGLAQADMTGLSGTYYFRARNTRGALVSAWSPISDAVVTLTPPNPPTLRSPANGSVHNYTSSHNVAMKWTHNPVDGSAQTSAQLQYSTDGGGTWTTQTINGTASSWTLALTSSFLGKTVTWRVRTKGSDASYGNYSSTRTFYVRQQPTVTITLTDGNNVDVTNGNLSDMPLNYSASVSGSGIGSLSSGTFSAETYTEAATVSGTTLTGSVTASEAQPENGRTYTVTVVASMSTGLTGQGSVTVTMDFADPQAGTLAIGDADGIASLTVGLEPIGAGEVAASDIAIQRVTADGIVTIASGLSAGDTMDDRYAPLNTDFEYRVMTYSTAGAARAVSYPYFIKSAFWMALWGSDGQAYGRYNPTGGIQVTRPKKTRQYFAGRQWPVSYDGINTGETHTVTLLLLTREEREAFAELMRQGGRGVYKSADGYVFRADFDFRYNGAWSTPERDGSVTVTVTRIDGAAL